MKISSDDGILDPDDILSDVADDREQIIAIFDEQCSPFLPHNGGDGTSASSVGTGSPDIFQNDDIPSLNKPPYNGSDVEITAENISSGIIPLHVRRGSEPALNRISPALLSNADPSKRWSAAVIVDESSSKILNSEGENSEQSEDEPPPGEREDGSGEEKSVPDTQFISSRKLIDLDSDCEELTWQNDPVLQLNKDKRREPLGGPRTSPKLSKNADGSNSDSSQDKFEVVKLKNEDGPLGIHVVPTYDNQEKDFGLLIQGIEPGGRIDRDGRCHIGDKITEINGVALRKESFQKAQEIFKDALKGPEISISCIKNNTSKTMKNLEKPSPPPVFPKPVMPSQKNDVNSNDVSGDDEQAMPIPKSVNVTPSRKSPASMLLKNTPAHSSLRKVGRRILIHLTKGSEGLGFSISAKESVSSSHLYIKSILPAGAAVEDGRLKIGDRIMEVNKTDVTNMTQPEVVDLLRQIPFGEMVELIVSRQETDNSPSPSLPRELPPDKAGDGVGIFPWKSREVFTFDIPLNDTGSAGLGVSVKGKTSNTSTGAIDMGIFVKSVIHGGAASKDGRLQTNDQLLNINGISLLGMTNSQAMETLRRAMIQGEGPNVIPNAITLTVARRIPSPSPDGNCDSSDGPHHDRSDSLLSESGDSFYVSTENLSSAQNKSEGITPETSTSENSANTVIFMSQSQRDSTMNNSSVTQDMSSEIVQSKSPLPGSNPIVEQLTGLDDLNDSELRLQSESPFYAGYEKWRESEHHQKNSTDNSGQNEGRCFSPTKTLETKSVWSQDSIRNLIHQKSFSNPAKLDYIVTPEQIKMYKDCSYNIDSTSAAPGNKVSLHNNVPSRSELTFARNGFGRQSMPEKKIINAAFREVGTYRIESPSTTFRGSGSSKDYTSSYQQSNHENTTHLIQHEIAPKEMPVDVGPCETYVKLSPNKPHRNRVGEIRSSSNPTWSNSVDSLASVSQLPPAIQQRSCHSPGCPYHIVSTTGRESEGSQGAPYQIGPSLGMCKSSSLESLQTMVHELQKRDVPFPVVCADGSTRACNESFRAAVDRSYDAQDTENMESGQDNESSNVHTQRSHLHQRSSTVAAPQEVNKKSSKCGKKKGILRGLGSVFRFGRASKKASQEISLESSKKEEKQQETECLLARKAAQEELERIQERYRRIVEQQHNMQMESLQHHSQQQQVIDQNPNRYMQSPHRATPVSNHVPHMTQPGLSPQSQSRRERMHFLRAEHQRRHQERRGYYPQEEKEELYEAQIKQIVDSKAMHKRPLPPLPHQRLLPNFNPNEHPHPQVNDFDASHSKSYNFDIYKEMSKPGSRMGFADPNLYSHYMNFQEIQQHLQQFHHQSHFRKSQMQDQSQNFQLQPYHQSSTRTRTMSPKHNYSKTLSAARSRPISNFFEYESVHNAKYPLNLMSESGTGSLPRRNLTSGRRQPIPTFMMQSRRDAPAPNGHASSVHYHSNSADNYEDIYYARKFEVPGSKV